MRQISKFVESCVDKGYIVPEQSPWLAYKLEGWATTAITLIPLCILGMVISTWRTTLFFVFSLFFLRSRTNGYHAKTPLMCFFLSLLSVIILLGVFRRFIDPIPSVLFSFLASLVVLFLAPYDHPNMNYDQQELRACRISARIRTGLLSIGVFISAVMQWHEVCAGIVLGQLMVAVLLLLAYINTNTKEENIHGQKRKRDNYQGDY